MTTPLSNAELREALYPFGNAAQIVGAKRVELYDVVRTLITSQKAISDAEIDRKARIDELEAIKILHRREVYTTNGATPEQDVINIRDRIAQLSTEDVKEL